MNLFTWPLVLKITFERLRADYRLVIAERDELRRKLAIASKNDARDHKGRFTKRKH